LKQLFPDRKAFLRKWWLKHRAIADSLKQAGDRLFTFTRVPLGQWQGVRTTNPIERLHLELQRIDQPIDLAA
jgi:transposase-like protein